MNFCIAVRFFAQLNEYLRRELSRREFLRCGTTFRATNEYSRCEYSLNCAKNYRDAIRLKKQKSVRILREVQIFSLGKSILNILVFTGIIFLPQIDAIFKKITYLKKLKIRAIYYKYRRTLVYDIFCQASSPDGMYLINLILVTFILLY